MLGSRFVWKLFAGYFALVVLAATLVGVFVSKWAEETVLDYINRSLVEKAELLRELATPALASSVDHDLAFQQKIRRMGGAIGTRLTVIRKNGLVIADSEKDPTKMDRHDRRPEVVAARESPDGLGMSTRPSRTLGQNMSYLAMCVKGVDGSPVGFVRTALPITAIQTREASLRQSVVFGALISAALALVLGFFVAQRVTAPLSSMTRAARSIADGDYQQRVATIGADEIGQLARAFNDMAGELQDRIQTMTKDHNELRAILSGMVEGVVAVDKDEHVVMMNDVAGAMLGVDPDSAIEQPVWEIVRVHEVTDAIKKALASGGDHKTETTVIRDQKETTLELTASPLRTKDYDANGAVVVLHDVTELRRLESVRRDFVSNASHELKTPITAIRGLVETMVEDGKMPDDTRKSFLQRVKNQSTQLSTLVSDLLTLSRLETSGLQEREPQDLRLAVQEVVDAQRPVADTKNLTVASHLPEVPVPIACGYETLRLVVSNLLDNAIKYTPDGGSVTVRVTREGNRALLIVEDTGIGIAREQQERIFERFYRVDKARSRELGGTGLGLSIVKHAVGSAGGDVTVESWPGKGSTFYVGLPMS